jgi:hypothetical protein
MRSKHPSLMVLTKRSAWAFKFGERGGNFTDCTPLVPRVSINSAVNNGSRWVAARTFEKPAASIHFAHTSPVYVQVGDGHGIVLEDAKFFIDWIDREVNFYEGYSGFRSEQDRQAMLEIYRKARAVYVRLAKP